MTTTSDLTAELQQELHDIERMFAELTQAVGMDMQDELLALFFPTQDECLNGLAQAISENNVEQIVGFAHKLKGAAGQLGGTRMATHCKRIEMAVKLKDMPTVMTEFAALQILGQKISEQLRVA
jgi:two-component system sensor histidine kinase TorS